MAQYRCSLKPKPLAWLCVMQVMNYSEMIMHTNCQTVPGTAEMFETLAAIPRTCPHVSAATS